MSTQSRTEPALPVVRIHVGSFTSHFAPRVAIEAAAAGAAPPSVEAVRDRVRGWSAHINEGLVGAGHLAAPLVWDESADHPAARVELAVDALRALKLLLCYDDGQGTAPATLPANPEADPRWVEHASANFENAGWAQLLAPGLWLPGRFDFTFRCPMPDGTEVEAGSVDALAGQLRGVAEQVFGGTPLDWVMWAAAGPGLPDLRAAARHAVGVLGPLATQAEAEALPVLLTA